MGLTKARVRTPTLSLASVNAVKCLLGFFCVEVELQLNGNKTVAATQEKGLRINLVIKHFSPLIIALAKVNSDLEFLFRNRIAVYWKIQ